MCIEYAETMRETDARFEGGVWWFKIVYGSEMV